MNIKVAKTWGFGDQLFGFSEGFGVLVCPQEDLLYMSEVPERTDHVAKVGIKLGQVIIGTHKTTSRCLVLGLGHVENGSCNLLTWFEALGSQSMPHEWCNL